MTAFKMSRIAQAQHGMRKAEIFYRIIERHAHASVSCTVDKYDLIKVVADAAREHPDLDANKLGNPFFPAFNGILTCLPQAQEAIGVPDPIDFIFDDQNESSQLGNTWDAMKAGADPHDPSIYWRAPTI
jgi:hypothetical protein